MFKRASAVNEEVFSVVAGAATMLAGASIILDWAHRKYSQIFTITSVEIIMLILIFLFMYLHIHYLKDNILKIYKCAIYSVQYQNRYVMRFVAFPFFVLFIVAWLIVTAMNINKGIETALKDFRFIEFTMIGLFVVPVITLNIVCRMRASYRLRRRKSRFKRDRSGR
ncbi:hypothetical protein [Methylobacterium indicum]|uniref:hypothetical protein n=1 Tax=Methylobacterium indicum TaxID=1775910 RepID=UPI001A9211F7|nr:hypothetical protein [Methylobacterium indicum]